MKNKESKFWNVVRWIVSVVLVLMIFVTIVISIPIAAVSSTITSRDNLKDHLEQSGIYENIFSVIVDFMPQQDEMDMLGFGDIINNMVTSEHAQKNVEGAIDGTYDWLEGKTDKPVFEISVIPEDIDITESLDNSLKDLSECTDDNSFTLQEGESFELTCRPAGLGLDILNLDSLGINKSIGEFKIKSSDLPISVAWAKQAQGIFFFLKYSPVFLALYIILLTVLLMWVMPGLHRGRGFITAGITLFVPGIIFLFISIGGSFLNSGFFFSSFGSAVSSDVLSVVSSLTEFLNLVYLEIMAKILHYSLAILVLAIILFIIGMVMRSKTASREKKKRLKKKVKGTAYKPQIHRPTGKK